MKIFKIRPLVKKIRWEQKQLYLFFKYLFQIKGKTSPLLNYQSSGLFG